MKAVVAGVPQALSPASDLLYRTVSHPKTRTLLRADSVATIVLGGRGKPLAGQHCN